MEARPTSGYIQIGTQVRFLADAREGNYAFGGGYIVSNADDLIKELLRLEMHVSYRLSGRLEKEIRKLHEEWLESENQTELERTRRLSDSEARQIRQDAAALRETMLAEAEGQIAFITRDKRYDVKKLLGDVGSLMAPGVFVQLPEIAQYDFAQAGRCTAFEVPTAAAFHLMRGTEAVLRHFYCAIVKRGRIDPMMWFPMTDQLSKRRTPPPGVLMANLDNLRKSFRNPTQHPDKMYDIDEVQDLFALSIDVVNRMIRHIRAIRGSAAERRAALEVAT